MNEIEQSHEFVIEKRAASYAKDFLQDMIRAGTVGDFPGAEHAAEVATTTVRWAWMLADAFNAEVLRRAEALVEKADQQR